MNSKLFTSSVITLSLLLNFPVITKAQSSSTREDSYGTHYICTRSGSGVVNIRKGPGVNYPKGLEQVGSGGLRVDQMFAETNYTLPVGFDLFDVFGSSSRGSDNFMWTNIGTNQWTGWIRSDFICKRR